MWTLEQYRDIRNEVEVDLRKLIGDDGLLY